MSYQIIFHPNLTEQAERQANFYQEKFSTGSSDFYFALQETVERIATMPHAGRRIAGKAESIRGVSIRANRGSKRYAKNFPFLLIYWINEDVQIVEVYQLWPERSVLPINDPPE